MLVLVVIARENETIQNDHYRIFPGDDYQDQHSSRASSLVTSLCIRSIKFDHWTCETGLLTCNNIVDNLFCGSSTILLKPVDINPFSYPEPFLRAVNGRRRGALAKSISNWHLIGYNEGYCSNNVYIFYHVFMVSGFGFGQSPSSHRA